MKTSSKQTGSKVPQDAGDLASSWTVEWVDDEEFGITAAANRWVVARATLPEGTLKVSDDREDGLLQWSAALKWSEAHARQSQHCCGAALSEQAAKKAAVLALARMCLQPERPLTLTVFPPAPAAALLSSWAEDHEKWREELIGKIQQRYLDRGLDAFVDEQQPSILNCDIFDKAGSSSSSSSVDDEPATQQPPAPDRRDSLVFQELGSWSRLDEPAPADLADLAGLVRAWWDLT